MIDEGKVEITKKEYKSLLRDSAILRALESGGVDNWEWYDEAMSSFWEEN